MLRKAQDTTALRKAKRRTKHLIFFISSCFIVFFTVYLADAYNKTQWIESAKSMEKATLNEYETSRAVFEEVEAIRSAIYFSEKFLESAKQFPILYRSTCDFKATYQVSKVNILAYKNIFAGCSPPSRVSNSHLPQLQEMLRIKKSTPDYVRADALHSKLEALSDRLRYQPKSYYPPAEDALAWVAIAVVPLFFLFVYTRLGINVVLKNSAAFIAFVAQSGEGASKGASFNIVNTDKLKHYSVAEELLKWKSLKDSGVVTEEEFIEAKEKILKL